MGSMAVRKVHVWNPTGKSHNKWDAKEKINEVCLDYINEKRRLREYDERASLGEKRGIIVAYFPQLTNEEIKDLGKMSEKGRFGSHYGSPTKKELLEMAKRYNNLWADEKLWSKGNLDEDNVFNMQLVHAGRTRKGGIRQNALAIANDEIVWMGGNCREPDY